MMASSNLSRVSRPNSLQLEGPQPEKEALKFEVQLVGAPPEVEQLISNIKNVAEGYLYHWKAFPIVLPQSRFSEPGVHLSDIIMAPPCEDISTIALEGGLEPQPLSPKQLHSIKEKGEFEVPSRHFPGQSQVWQIAPWVYRGRVRARDELYGHLALAASLIVVVARDRLCRDKTFSVVSGFRELLAGLHRLLDLLVGMPYLEARDLDKRIRDERSRYLVAELICKPEYEGDLNTLAAWVEKAVRRVEAGEPIARRPPPVPMHYTTPSGIEIDLRLQCGAMLAALAPGMAALAAREARGWLLAFRERVAADTHPEDIQEACAREYIRRMCSGLPACTELQPYRHLHPLLVEQMHVSHAHYRAEEEMRKKLEAGLATAEARIDISHPILSRSPAWKKEKLKAAKTALEKELSRASMEQAAGSMPSAQAKYFLQRDLTFITTREPVLLKELLNDVSPCREFRWRAAARSRASPHANAERISDTRLPGWRVTNIVYRSWCWWWHVMYLVAAVVWDSSVSVRALVLLTPYSPRYYQPGTHLLSLCPWKSASRDTSVCKREVCHTMWSRSLALWRYVARQRRRFDAEPDNGLLGKGLSRLSNRVWYYGVVGGLGTFALLFIFPVCAIACILLAGVVAILCPLLVPAVAILAHIGSALIWEIDNLLPNDRWFPLIRATVWRIGVLGILQPVAAAVVACVICPITSLILLIVSCLWGGVRAGWETVWWRALRSARAPRADSALCRRAPAAAANHHYTLSASQAYAAILARAEAEILTLWYNKIEEAINKPVKDYKHFVEACFGPFSVQIAKTGAFKQLEKECAELKSTLKEKVATRRGEIALTLSDNVRSRTRMTKADLKRAVYAAGAELSRLAPSLGVPPSIPTASTTKRTITAESTQTHNEKSKTLAVTSERNVQNEIAKSGSLVVESGFAKSGEVKSGVVKSGVGEMGAGVGSVDEASEEWWDSRGLRPGDWSALAASFLADMFCSAVLCAVEASDAGEALGGNVVGGASGGLLLPPSSPPDVLQHCSGGWGLGLGVSLPPPPAPRWSPRAAPPPLPPPPLTALLLYNRDTENPLPLDSELCAEILRLLDEAPDTIEQRDVSRIREESEEASAATSEGDADEWDDATRHAARHDTTQGVGDRWVGARCEWTLTGRGARLRADLASPEDSELDDARPALAARYPHHLGTEV